MQTFTPEELDEDILSDLLEEINELYEAAEQTLIELELRPEDNELQRSLFRSIHTIKGDLGLVNFTPMLPLLQHVEDLLDYLRKGQVHYTSTMSDLVLLVMDKVKLFVSACFNNGHANYDSDVFERLVHKISLISPQNGDLHEQLLSESVYLLNPNFKQPHGGQADNSVTLANTGIPKNISKESQIDMLFFRELIKPIERRSVYWQGRSDRIAKLAFYINDIAGNPLDRDQNKVVLHIRSVDRVTGL